MKGLIWYDEGVSPMQRKVLLYYAAIDFSFSSSPRRKELLQLLQIPFESMNSECRRKFSEQMWPMEGERISYPVKQQPSQKSIRIAG